MKGKAEFWNKEAVLMATAWLIYDETTKVYWGYYWDKRIAERVAEKYLPSGKYQIVESGKTAEVKGVADG